jgi:hypothetical protein
MMACKRENRDKLLLTVHKQIDQEDTGREAENGISENGGD